MKLLYVTVWAKTHIYSLHQKVYYRYTQYLSIPSNINWFAYLEGILPILQNDDWNSGTNWGQK